MADNVQVTPGSGATIAADDVSGVLVQRVKVQWGVDGVATDASAATPLPVAVTGDAATPLTNAQLRAADVAVTLDSEVVNVTGPLTNAQLRAADVAITLDSEVVSVTGPLTDAQLRATPVPVTGALTDAQLRASDVPVTLGGEDVVVVEKVVPLTTVSGIVNTLGDNTIIASPGAGNRIVLAEMSLQLEGSTATTVIVKSGSTAQRRWLFPSIGSGVSWVYDQGREVRLFENNALVFNLGGANSIGYTVRYFVETV